MPDEKILIGIKAKPHPDRKGYLMPGADEVQVYDVSTGKKISGVRDVKIHLPLNDIATARIIVILSEVDLEGIQALVSKYGEVYSDPDFNINEPELDRG